MTDERPKEEDFSKYYYDYLETISSNLPDESQYEKDCQIAKMLANAYGITVAEASERISRLKSRKPEEKPEEPVKRPEQTHNSQTGQKPTMTGKVKYMTNINVSGSADFEKVKLEHKSRQQATIKEIEDIKKFPPHKNAKDQTTKVPKIPYVFDIDGKRVSALIVNKVSKGGGTYSNSKLYDILAASGDLETFLKEFGEGDADSEAVLKFLRDKHVSRKCEVEISNAKKGEEGEYSMVKDIIKFADQTTTTPPAEEPAK